MSRPPPPTESALIQARPALKALTHTWSFFSEHEGKITWACEACLIATESPYHELCPDRVLIALSQRAQALLLVELLCEEIDLTPLVEKEDTFMVLVQRIDQGGRQLPLVRSNDLCVEPDAAKQRASRLLWRLGHAWDHGAPAAPNALVCTFTSTCCGLSSTWPHNRLCPILTMRMFEAIEAGSRTLTDAMTSDIIRLHPERDQIPAYRARIAALLPVVATVRTQIAGLQ